MSSNANESIEKVFQNHLLALAEGSFTSYRLVVPQFAVQQSLRIPCREPIVEVAQKLLLALAVMVRKKLKI